MKNGYQALSLLAEIIPDNMGCELSFFNLNLFKHV